MPTPQSPDRLDGGDPFRKQIAGQAAYYAERKPVRMTAVDTPYVRRHFAEATACVPVQHGHRVCEWGAGLGRFTRLFAGLGCPVTAIELSPALATSLHAVANASPNVTVEVGDILEIEPRLARTYDVVAGFFVLHHLPAVDPYLRMAARILRPEGRFVFVEPNPLNPLYALQITAAPGMRWSEEIGIYRMWPRAIGRAAHGAGFTDFRTIRYGALPRALYNIGARLGVERWPEMATPRTVRPFQVFSARLSG